MGLEPTRLSAPDPKSGVTTNSTTRAFYFSNISNNFLFLYFNIRKVFLKAKYFFELKVGFEPTYHDFADRDFTYQTFEH